MPWEAAQKLLDQAMKDEIFPGYSLFIRHNAQSWQLSGGMAEKTPFPRLVTSRTPWDLASLTKVLCTTTLAMRFADRFHLADFVE